MSSDSSDSKQPSEARPVLLLTVAALICLLPFLNKPIHIDDPLFIWTAQQIRAHPLDFYGFLVDWDRQSLPMPYVMQNPPLTGYYLAAVVSVFGWSEKALHFGFLFPALALVLGTYFLARHFCSQPLAAAAGVLAAPVFLLCGTSLMCDTMMAALWVWAVFFWIEGLKRSSRKRLFASALLIAAASMTKYFGACLLPLLFVYTLMQRRGGGERISAPFHESERPFNRTALPHPVPLPLGEGESSPPVHGSKADPGPDVAAPHEPLNLKTSSPRPSPPQVCGGEGEIQAPKSEMHSGGARALVWLALPVLVLLCYQFYTQHLYGKGLITNAAVYANDLRVGGGLGSRLLAALSFTGGCVLLPLVALPWLTRRGVTAACLGGAVLLTIILGGMGKIGTFSVAGAGSSKWLVVAQLALFICGGAVVLGLAVADIFARKDADSALLFLWAVGTFVFAGVVNWTVSGRNILPLVPVVSILLVRRLELKRVSAGADIWQRLAAPLAVSLAVGWAAVWGDAKLAESARTAAIDLHQKFSAGAAKVTFECHWGFQYYSELLGGQALSWKHLDLVSNEVIFVPENNTHGFPLPNDKVERVLQYHVAAAPWVAVMSRSLGAGFYSDHWGPAPFIFGRAPMEDYNVFRVTKPLSGPGAR